MTTDPRFHLLDDLLFAALLFAPVSVLLSVSAGLVALGLLHA